MPAVRIVIGPVIASIASMSSAESSTPPRGSQCSSSLANASRSESPARRVSLSEWLAQKRDLRLARPFERIVAKRGELRDREHLLARAQEHRDLVSEGGAEVGLDVSLQLGDGFRARAERDIAAGAETRGVREAHVREEDTQIGVAQPMSADVHAAQECGVPCHRARLASGRATLRALTLEDWRWEMAGTLTLYVCHIDEGGPKPHACRRAQNALREHGHEFEKVIYARGHLFGLFTKGRRPELKQMSGQEMLPVLLLADGATISGSANIIAWAKENRPEPAG